MIIINRKLLMAHNCCGESLDEFTNILGNGDVNFEIEFQDGINYIQNLQLDRETKLAWLVFVRSLKDSPQFYLMQGAAVMNEKYHVMNPLTGQHEEATTLDDARALQQRIKDDFLAANISLFVIGQEVFVAEENKSLWKTVE